MARHRIMISQIWRKMDGLPTLWQVERVTQDRSGHAHVILRRLDDLTTTRLIAAQGLEDSRLYRLEREPEPEVPKR